MVGPSYVPEKISFQSQSTYFDDKLSLFRCWKFFIAWFHVHNNRESDIPKSHPKLDNFVSKKWVSLMHGSNCAAPSHPGRPRNITFWGAAPAFLSLYLYLAPPSLITLIPTFSSAPLFFITHIFPLIPELGREGWWRNNLTGALLFLFKKFDHLKSLICSVATSAGYIILR